MLVGAAAGHIRVLFVVGLGGSEGLGGGERTGRLLLTFSEDSEQNFSASARYLLSPSSLWATTSAEDPSV